VKFRLNDVHFFDRPVYQPNFDLNKYKRFQPYKLTGSIDLILSPPANNDETTEFVSGKADQTTVYNRKSKESSRVIVKLHSEMIEALESFLQPKFSLLKANISIEMTRFSGNIADLVTKDGTGICIYEIKTGASARKNIREALSQLLDYALHAGQLTVQRLTIVSPVAITEREIRFLKSLNDTIKFPVNYLEYIPSESIKFLDHKFA
jgi:hypothetical protein